MEMNTNPTMRAPGKKIGPVIGALIIIVLLVIAALYVWGAHLNTTQSETSTTYNTNDSMASETASAVQAQMSASDDINSLSNDISATEKSDTETSF